jgi:HAD superfamily hydrolase (TIGR01549 family)
MVVPKPQLDIYEPMKTPQNKILAICLDCGDTLADERTEIKDPNGVTQTADLIPGAADMVRAIKKLGYPLALVADGPTGTFQNILTQHQLYTCFDVFAISEQVGVLKPDAKMFTTALDQLGIAKKDYARVIMVGNNLERDIKGANALGLISVFLSWSNKRTHIPADETEIPQHTIQTPIELLSLIDKLEAQT